MALIQGENKLDKFVSTEIINSKIVFICKAVRQGEGERGRNQEAEITLIFCLCVCQKHHDA